MAAAKRKKDQEERHARLIALGKKKARLQEYLESPDGAFILGRGPQAFKMLREAYDTPNAYAWCKPFVLYLWGDTGAGKSRQCRAWLKDTCQLPAEEVWIFMESDDYKWHTKYRRQKAIILDDFTGGMSQKKIRNVLDGYEMPYEDKGGDVVHCPRVIVITSDREPALLELKGKDKEGYPILMLPHEVAQIARRIDQVIHFTWNVSCKV